MKNDESTHDIDPVPDADPYNPEYFNNIKNIKILSRKILSVIIDLVIGTCVSVFGVWCFCDFSLCLGTLFDH